MIMIDLIMNNVYNIDHSKYIFFILYIFVYKMKYMWIEFKNKMEPFRVFSIRDIRKMFPGLNNMNLVRWQQKGYLVKIINGWYCFADNYSNENIQWLSANLIYKPSYISLHTALSFYNLIPEAIYPTTSVTTKKTRQFVTLIGNLSYNKLKPQVFGFGHTLIDSRKYSDVSPDIKRYNRQIIIAEMEKAILDFFYINPQYNTEKEIAYLRFDNLVLKDMDKEKFYKYLDRFSNKALENRIFKMMKAYAII